LRERSQLEKLHRPKAPVLGEEGSKRMPPVQLIAAVGADEQEGFRVGVADQKREEVAGRSIGPVEILHGEHDGTFGAQISEQGEELLEQPGLSELASHGWRGDLVRGWQGVRGWNRTQLGQ
jgi:hypothetical protein